MKALIPFACGSVAALAIAGFSAMGPASVTSPVQFKDVTAAAGIQFKHNAGKAGKKYLPETMGAGVAIFDYNGDGKPDILFVNSKDFEPHGKRTICALYRNNDNGTFTDVTAGSGLDIEMYGIGVSHGRLRQRRPRRYLHHSARRRPPLPQRRRTASSET